MKLSPRSWTAVLLCLILQANSRLAAPRLESGDAELDRLFEEADRAVDDSIVDGAFPIPEDPGDRVAQVYLPSWLSLSLTHPEASKKTLAKLAEEEHIIDLEGYPERLDPLFWILAAESLDEDFQRTYLPAMARLCRLVWEECRDPETGLLRGGLAWISGHEAFSNLEEPGDELTLAANATAVAAFRAVARMGKGTTSALTDPDWFLNRAGELAQSIQHLLWNDEAGYYRRAVDVDEWCGLGNAMAVLAGVSDPLRSAVVMNETSRMPSGIPERTPSDRAMPEWRPNHSVLWQTQAAWAWAANRNRRLGLLDGILHRMRRNEDFLSTEGLELRNMERRPTTNPLIPASALLGVFCRGALGIEFDGPLPLVTPLGPPGLSESLSLSGLIRGNREYHIVVQGRGAPVARVSTTPDEEDRSPSGKPGKVTIRAKVDEVPRLVVLTEAVVGGEKMFFSVECDPQSSEARVVACTAPRRTPAVIEPKESGEGLLSYTLRMPVDSPAVWLRLETGEPESWRAVRRAEPVEVLVIPSDGVFLATPAAQLGGYINLHLTPRSQESEYAVSVQADVPEGWHVEPEGFQRTFSPRDVPAHEVFFLQVAHVTVSGTEELRLMVDVNDESEEFVYPLWRRDGIDLAGEWRFRIGDDLAWADPAVSDATWDTLRVPGWWEDQGFVHDGWAWYRKTVEIPEDWNGAWSVITAGAIDDEDALFINGKQVASGKGWETPRRYVIPPNALRPGEPNLIAIRVNDYYGGGGINKGPVRWITGPTIESLAGD